jgi:hypothetical protein
MADNTTGTDYLDAYAGTKAQVFRDFGEDIACRDLHKRFGGNAAATADFLGFKKHTSVSKRWSVCGLQSIGTDNPRRDYRASAPDARVSIDPATGERSGWTDDDWWDYLCKRTSTVERAVDCEWALPRGSEFGVLHFIGDTHFGNADQDLGKLLEFVEWLSSPEQKAHRWVFLGDMFEVRAKASPGGEPIMPQDVAFRMACRALAPVMGQCLVVHTGNHDQRVQIQTDMPFDPTRDFAREFGVPWAGRDGFHRLHLTCGKLEETYVGYCHHGFGGARTKGARANQLQTMLRSVRADYVAMAHLHDRDGVSDTRFGPDKDGIIEQFDLPAVRSGSWLKHGPGSYSREGGFPPGMRGAATLYPYITKHDVHRRT